jgi:hypothetical protein
MDTCMAPEQGFLGNKLLLARRKPRKTAPSGSVRGKELALDQYRDRLAVQGPAKLRWESEKSRKRRHFIAAGSK